MIRPLSDAVQSKVRSGVAITSITQCTEELVMNSLDAGATCIAIRVDLPCFKVQVVDNGQGMSREQLGKVGERYSTSKCHEVEDLNNLHYFGYRGEAIASMRDTAAILEINSRTTQSHQTYCRMFQRGSSLPVSESAVQRPSVGTTVTVHDLFYSLPVRRKAVNEALELERIRYRVEGIALIHPSISFSLRNDVTGHVLLQTRKSISSLTSFTHLFGQARAKSLREASVQKESFEVEGYIGKEGYCNKNLQFVFVNSRLVLKTKIHKVLNHVLRRSLVLKKKGTSSDSGPSKTQAGDAQMLSPPKQGEKYAVFVLNVKCPLDVYDITFDPAKTLVEFKDWSILTSAIDEMVMSFLKRENLLSLSPSLSSCTTGQDITSLKQGEEWSDPEDEGGNDANLLDKLNQNEEITEGLKANDQSSTDYASNISTQNATNCLFSRTVRRPVCEGTEAEKNGRTVLETRQNECVAEGTQIVEETPMTVDDCCHKSDTCSPETPQIAINSAQLSESGPSTKSLSVSHDNFSSDTMSSTLERHALESSMSESGNVSVDSKADAESEHCMTQEIQDAHRSETAPGESEDPFPNSLRNPLSKHDGQSTTGNNKICSGVTLRKPLICLPDSPSTSRPLGVHRLHNLRLISSKQSHSSAAEIMSKRLGLAAKEHTQKSAAQKISERLGLKERKAINEKLQKFKSTIVSSRQNNTRKSTVTSACDDDVKSPAKATDQDHLTVRTVTETHHPEPIAGATMNGTIEKAASPESFPGKMNNFNSDSQQRQLQNIDNREVLQDVQNTVRTGQSKSEGEELIHGKFSRTCSQNGSDTRTPIIPSVADIDFLTSRSVAAARKRFNPFELSTAAKLSKLARKTHFDKQEQETSECKQREFLSTTSLIETPVSVFKARYNSTKNSEEQMPGATEQQQRFADQYTLDQETGTVDLSCQAHETVKDDLRAHSEESCHLENIESRPDWANSPSQNNTALPFTVYTDKDHLKNMDVSEAESEDSVVLPHIDCFSPVRESPVGTKCSPDVSTQPFQPSVLQSQGFSSDARIFEDDCQSGGFSPRNMDDVISSSSTSPSVPHAAGRVEELESTANCTAYGKDVHEHLSGQPNLNPTDAPEVCPVNTFCESTIDDAGSDQTDAPEICQGNTFCESTIDDAGLDSEMTSVDVISESKTASSVHIINAQVSSEFAHHHVVSDARILARHEEELAGSPSDENVESSIIVCGQVSTHTAKSDMCHTDDDDSFPLRTLLPSDSPELKMDKGNNQFCHLPISKGAISSHDIRMDTVSADLQVARNVNVTDENLANDSVRNSRDVTVHKPCTSREMLYPQTDSVDQSKQSCDALTDDRDTDLVSASSSVCDKQLSSSTTETQEDQKGEVADVWSEVKDPNTGRIIYVNSLTGNTMFEEQWRQSGYRREKEEESDLQAEPCGSRGPTASPKPLCPSDRDKLHHLLTCHLEGKTSDDQVKWRQPCPSTADQSETGESGTLEDLFSSWDNPVYDLPHQSCVSAEVSHPSRAAVQSYQTLYPTKFTKTMLRSVQVLGQVDNKFIACVLNTNEKNMTQPPDLIVLIDQHAAHERVRVEQLTEDIYSDSDESCIKQSQVSPPKTLTFTEEEVRLIKSFREEFRRIGIVFTISGSSRDSLNIHSIPACLVEREANEVKRGRESVAMDIAESLIKEHLEMLRVTGGARNRLPQTIHKVLCSQACHGAVKFGDGLGLSQCQELLESLALCDLPFQCAHGRPSVMPLLGLQQLKSKLPPQRIKRPNLWKISKNLPIHQ